MKEKLTVDPQRLKKCHNFQTFFQWDFGDLYVLLLTKNKLYNITYMFAIYEL